MSEDMSELEDLVQSLMDEDFEDGKFTPWSQAGYLIVGPKGMRSMGKGAQYPSPYPAAQKAQNPVPPTPPVPPKAQFSNEELEALKKENEELKKKLEEIEEDKDKMAKKKTEEEEEEMAKKKEEEEEEKKKLEATLKEKEEEIARLKGTGNRAGADNAADLSKHDIMKKLETLSIGELLAIQGKVI